MSYKNYDDLNTQMSNILSLSSDSKLSSIQVEQIELLLKDMDRKTVIEDLVTFYTGKEFKQLKKGELGTISKIINKTF